MTNRERFVATMDGRTPDRIPYLAYGGYVRDNNRHLWAPLIDRGLIVMPRVNDVAVTADGVEDTVTVTYDARGYAVERRVLRTSVGELSQVRVHGWTQEYFIKTPGDYRVMKYILEHTQLTPDFGGFAEAERTVGDTGATIVRAERSPMQKVIVDYAGLANYSYHLTDAPVEMNALLEAYEDYALRYFTILADHPSRYIQIPENLTSEQTGPARFIQHHIPFYNKIIPMLHAKGKKVFAHYDGRFACLIDLIPQTGLDGLESFTAPPEGDIGYGRARAALPDTTFMAHIRLSDYKLPPGDLKKLLHGYIREAAPDGRNLLFELSEDLPANWQESIPAALDAINDYKI